MIYGAVGGDILQILLASLYTAVLVVLIIVIRSVALYRLPKQLFVFLWNIALLRSIFLITIPQKVEIGSRQLMAVSILNAVDNINFFHQPMIKMIWLIGAILSFLTIVCTHVKACLEYRFALPVEESYIENWRISHPLKRNIRVRQSDKVVSAMTYNLFKPVILLPSSTDLKNSQNLQYILTHEYVHIKHFDLLNKWIFVVSLSIHWFNPFVWLLFIIANRDMELACDEKVIYLLGNHEKSSYARFLLDMSTNRVDMLAPVKYMAKDPLEERIVSLMKTTRRTRLTAFIACLIVMFLILVGFKTISYVQGFSDLNDQRNIIVHGSEDETDDFPSYANEASDTNEAQDDYEVSLIG